MKQPEPLDFNLRVITPAFIAGATEEAVETPLKHKDKPPRLRRIGPAGDGLRIPSLRGVLRFWFRAKEGLCDPGKLALQEAKVFGGTETGQGLRFIPCGDSGWSAKEIYSEVGGPAAYLGYGILHVTRAEVSSHSRFAFRDAVQTGTTFSFRAIGTAEQLEQLRRTLILLHLFGGVGGRSRRGWGSVAVTSPPVPLRAEGETQAAFFARCLTEVWPETKDRPQLRAEDPLYSAFWSGAEGRWFEDRADGSVLNDPRQVFEEFFRQFRATRLFNLKAPTKSPPIASDDYAAEEATATGDRIASLPQRLAFGMPYTVRFKNKPAVEYVARYRRDGEKIEITRRASPLFLKVLELSPGRFGGMALFLRSRFFSHAGAKVGAKKRKGELDPPGYSAVEAFLRESPWKPLDLP